MELKTVSVVSFEFVAIGCECMLLSSFISVDFSSREVIVLIPVIFVKVNGRYFDL